jgi:hypothetical protein
MHDDEINLPPGLKNPDTSGLVVCGTVYFELYLK